MSDFRLFMWMLFVITVLGIVLIAIGQVDSGGTIVFGTGALAFVVLFGRSLM